MVEGIDSVKVTCNTIMDMLLDDIRLFWICKSGLMLTEIELF
jgi:hypothetical protein